MKNIINEMIYSMKKSSFFNMILIALFTLLLWLLTLVISYYLDMPVMQGVENIKGDYAYYTPIYAVADNENEGFDNQLSDYEYIDKARRTLNDIQNSSEYIYMSIGEATISADYDFMNERLDQDNILDFMGGSCYPGYYYKPENYNPEFLNPINVGYSNSAFEPIVFRIDENAMKHFEFKTVEGNLFSTADFIYNKEQAEIPILMGKAYQPYFKVGDTFEMYYCGVFQVRVIGFLEENTTVITDQMQAEEGGGSISFDNSMVVPFFHIQSEPENEDEKMFAQWNYDSYLNGFIVTDKDVPRSEVTKMEKQINAAFVRNGLFPVILQGSPYGLEIFKKESEQTVAILLSLVIIMAIFSVFCICLCLITKINRNLRRYAIQIMNGQSIKAIIASFFLEIVLIFLSSMSFAAVLLRNEIELNSSFLFFIVAVSVMITFIVSMIIVKKLKGLDIEELIRRSE